MITLYVLRGIPASGKSTWAKKQAEECYNTIIVNRDKIREMLKGEYKNFPFNSIMEKLITKIEQFSADLALSRGYNVIIDATNLNSIIIWEKLAKRYEAELEIIDFTHVPLEICIKRDSEREFPIGEEIITKFYNKWQRDKV